MVDTVSPEARSRIMSRIRSSNTGPERTLRGMLARAGIRGWVMQAREHRGTPDFAFPGLRIAVFVDGDFWHGRLGVPRSNVAFWRSKFERNRKRDEVVNACLAEKGWAVVRVRESELVADHGFVLRKIRDALKWQSRWQRLERRTAS